MIISCAKTNLPILGGPGWSGHRFSRAVLLREGRLPAAGQHDGDKRFGGLDLEASGVLDEIREGTACLVLEDRYRAGDTPTSLGPSHIETDPERRPNREFIHSCARIGGFATYEGYLLACEGKVSPETGAALTDEVLFTMRWAASGMRQAIAMRLTDLASGSSRPAQEAAKLVAPTVRLDVLPLDAEGRKLRLVGGPGLAQGGMPVEFGLGDEPASTLEEMAAELIRWFPPRKKATAMLTVEDGSIGAISLHEAPELGVKVYVSRTRNDIGLFGSAEQAVDHQLLSPEDSDTLALAVDSLQSGDDVHVTAGRDLPPVCHHR